MREDALSPDIRSAIADARGGILSVIAIQGEAGFGKTTLMRRVVSALDGFELRRSFGEEGVDAEPLSLVSDLVAPAEVPNASSSHAIRALADFVDGHQTAGPVAFVVDDLQWSDAASVAALAGLALRSVATRLLVVVAYRPLRGIHPLWERMVRDLPARTVELTGLSVEEISAMIAAPGAAAPPGLAAALHGHTDGNPLHLSALLREHDVPHLAELASRGDLPVPLQLAQHLESRIARLSPDASRLLNALAVIGDEWADLTTAAAVADVTDARAAARVLADEGLVRLEGASSAPRVRIFHAVVCAAIYDVMSERERRRLHGAAAEHLLDTGRSLQHRAAAAAGTPDDDLERALVDQATALHAERRYREAARSLRLAAEVADGGRRRRELLLDAELESALGGDIERIAVDAAGVDDDPRAHLVAAVRAQAGGEWARAADILARVPDDLLDGGDALTAHRVRVMRVWCGSYAGWPWQTLLRDVQALERSTVVDPAMTLQRRLGSRQGIMPTFDETTGWAEIGFGVDRARLVAGPEGGARLALRGVADVLAGFAREAVDDLILAQTLVGEGLDLTDGMLRGFLTFGHFLVGDWRRAAISGDIARTTGLGLLAPATLAASPLVETVAGDPVRAREARTATRQWMLRGMYDIGRVAADIADVLSLAFVGDEGEQRAWRAARIADLGDPAQQVYRVSSMVWIFAHGLAATWAGDADAVTWWADRLDERTLRSPFVGGAVRLLRTLGEGTGGADVSQALRALAEEGFADITPLSAIAFLEAAHSAERHGRPEAGPLRERAASLVGAFGGVVTFAPATDGRGIGAGGEPSEAGREPSDVLAGLTERERAVVHLVVDGLSYAQIANELYVTQSTVSFHLSRCYAKTNTRSRHQLAALLRGH